MMIAYGRTQKMRNNFINDVYHDRNKNVGIITVYEGVLKPYEFLMLNKQHFSIAFIQGFASSLTNSNPMFA